MSDTRLGSIRLNFYTECPVVYQSRWLRTNRDGRIRVVFVLSHLLINVIFWLIDLRGYGGDSSFRQSSA